ncbi:Ribosomal RNA large subunit methyltransferase G [Pseudoalteromonas holothuriae]|uniref:Ribosomal RNA large subunit methyltransferase G n=1 Tax=Pseudoalteromonas holothuriae TaxID=2963714 RepID=A0ABM9GFT4_9GAMM|nr:methyltransferase [Pseudoalteromonas sp. CIP111951]CAH9051785.1 Ribosomal RNA large subunit methyltransferase G [Pseudoalteromonas sp. CIP111951]
MTTDALLGGHDLTLHRFPLEQKNRSLQAWDAADEYLINYVLEHHNQAKRILVLNDNFGALTCALKVMSVSERHITNVNDSYVSHQACEYNLANNQINDSAVTYLDSLSEYPHNIDLILIKIPKNAGFLAHQLALLSNLTSETKVIASGKVKEIHSSTLKSFNHFLSEPTTSLAVKKARLIFSKTTAKPVASKFPVSWPLEKTEFTLTNHANVFSRDSLDIGARFFMNYLPQGKKPFKVIDLGCGNGVIGLISLDKMPNAQVTFVDESAMAVASAKENITLNLPDALERCHFVQNDCLSDFTADSADLVLCNPPFHQAQAITDHIAWQMFVQAKQVLKKGGELRIIGNRHLDYQDKLNRLFGNCKVIGNNKKFTVLSSMLRG